MTTRFKAMFPGVLTPSMTKDAEALILAAYEAADISFGIKEAATWGDSVPQWGGIGDKIVEQDEAIIRSCGFSLEKAATAKMAPDLPNRLSVGRVLNLLPDNPERERLLSIVGGVKVIVPPDFVPNGSGNIIPPLRRKYELGAPAVNRSNFETYVTLTLTLTLSEGWPSGADGGTNRPDENQLVDIIFDQCLSHGGSSPVAIVRDDRMGLTVAPLGLMMSLLP
jgi:hypothetical protein